MEGSNLEPSRVDPLIHSHPTVAYIYIAIMAAALVVRRNTHRNGGRVGGRERGREREGQRQREANTHTHARTHEHTHARTRPRTHTHKIYIFTPHYFIELSILLL